MRRMYLLGIHTIKENKENIKILILGFLTPGLFGSTKTPIFNIFSTFFFINTRGVLEVRGLTALHQQYRSYYYETGI